MFARLFSQFDSDMNGVISSDKVDIEAVDDKILRVLMPLLRKLDDGEEMGIQNFVAHMEVIWGQLSQVERGYFLSRREPNQGIDNNAGKLSMSYKSIQLAEKKRAFMVSDNVYERFKLEQKLKEMKQQKIHEEAIAYQLKECTFQPSIKK